MFWEKNWNYSRCFRLLQKAMPIGIKSSFKLFQAVTPKNYSRKTHLKRAWSCNVDLKVFALDLIRVVERLSDMHYHYLCQRKNTFLLYLFQLKKQSLSNNPFFCAECYGNISSKSKQKGNKKESKERKFAFITGKRIWTSNKRGCILTHFMRFTPFVILLKFLQWQASEAWEDVTPFHDLMWYN